jgi:SAM-dependent methyltransferase
LTRDEEFERQDALYAFPYHWLPHLDARGTVRLHRELSWGLDYLTYVTHVVGLIRELQPESLCDVGCGDGRLVNLASAFVPRVVGVDVSERAVAFARAFNPGARIVCQDVSEVGGNFDVVTLIEVLEHVPSESMGDFIRAVADRVRTGGHLIVTVPSKNVPTSKKHYRHYDLDRLVDTLSPEFTIEQHWWLYRRGPIEGLIRRALLNRLFLLRYAPALRLAWRLHERLSYYADFGTGLHLACLATPTHPRVG